MGGVGGSEFSTLDEEHVLGGPSPLSPRTRKIWQAGIPAVLWSDAKIVLVQPGLSSFLALSPVDLLGDGNWPHRRGTARGEHDDAHHVGDARFGRWVLGTHCLDQCLRLRARTNLSADHGPVERYLNFRSRLASGGMNPSERQQADSEGRLGALRRNKWRHLLATARPPPVPSLLTRPMITWALCADGHEVTRNGRPGVSSFRNARDIGCSIVWNARLQEKTGRDGHRPAVWFNGKHRRRS